MTSSSASRKAKIQAATPQGRAGGNGANRAVVAAVVVVVVIAAVVTAVVLGSQDKKQATTAGGSSLPKGASAMGAGILVNPQAPSTVPTLDLYEDFQCPICAEFEHRFGADIVSLADKNQVRLVVHTLSFLDDNLRNDSSIRAANGAACAADQGKFLPYHSANFGGQPLKEGAGYTDADLRSFAEKAGITGAALQTWQQCYDTKAHNQYVVSVQTQSEKDGVNGTPTLKLDGKTLDLQGFTAETLAAPRKAATK
jgi:protein-disulfide isomerase